MAVFACALLTDRVGRKRWATIAFLVGGLLLTTLGFNDAKSAEIVMYLGSAAYGVMGTITVLLYLYILEIYPTRMSVIDTSLSNTSIEEEEQMSLFEDIDQRERAYALAKTIDEIRMRYGKNSVLRASSHLEHSTACYRNGLHGGHKA